MSKKSEEEPKVYEHKTLTYKGKMIFSKIVIGDFKRILKYFQEEEACFMFIDNVSFVVRTPDETIRFDPGDGFLAKCGNYYFEKRVEKEDVGNKTVLIGAYFYPSVIKEIFDEDFKASNYKTNYDACKVKIDSLLLNFKENINFLLDNPEVVDELLVLTKLKEFLLLLAKTEKAPSVIDFISSLFKPYEYTFKSTIENNLYASLSLDEFAKLCGMSLATFKRKFNEVYLESPRKYISIKKMEKASQMLRVKENRIAHVAYDCGFESVATFNRNFKNHFGHSPTVHRLNQND